MHLPRRRIVEFARRDASARRLRRAAAHLERCPSCRARLARVGEIRDSVREATAPEAPDRFDEVLARLERGDVILLPTADPAPSRSRMPGRAAAGLAALGLTAAAAVAAVVAMGPSDPSPRAGAPAAAALPSPPVAGLAVPAGPDSFLVHLEPPYGAAALRVAVTGGDVVEVRGVGAAAASRFQSAAEGIYVAGVPGGEVHVSVPASAARVVVRLAGSTLVEVVGGRLRVHAPARIDGDSAVFLALPGADRPAPEAAVKDAPSGEPR